MPWLTTLIALSGSLGAPALAAPGAAAPACPAGSQPVLETTALGRTHLCRRPDGQPDGAMLRLREDGSVAERGAYEGGLKSGTWTTHDAGGQRLGEERWVAGLQLGTWSSWSPSGELLATGSARPLELPEDGLPQPRNTADARVRWSLDLGAALGQPLEDWGTVLLVPTLAHLAAVDPVDGRFAWLAPLDHRPLPGVVALEGGLVVATEGKELVLIELEPGQIRSVRHHRAVERLVGAGKELVVAWEDVGRLSGMDPSTGQARWKSTDFFGPVVPVAMGSLVLASRNRELRAVVSDTGEVAWRVNLPSTPKALAVGTDRAWVLDAGGDLTSYDSRGVPGTTAALPGATAAELGKARLALVDGGMVVVGATTTWWVDEAGELLAQGSGGGDQASASAELHGVVRGGVLELRSLGEDAPRVSLGSELPPQQALFSGGLAVVVDLERHLLGIDLARAEAQAMSGLQAVELPEDTWLAFEEAVVEVRQEPRGGADAVVGVVPRRVRPEVVAGLGASGDCTHTLVSLDLSELDEVVDATPGPVVLTVSELELPDEAWALEPGWHMDAWQTTTTTSWWHRWQPRIVSGWPYQGDQEVLSSTLACGGPAVSYMGQIQLDDGRRRWRYEGRILVEPDATPTPWGGPSCVVHVQVGDETLGWWTGVGRQGWVDLSLDLVQSGTGQPAAAGDAMSLEGALVDGGRVRLMEVGQSEPVELELPPGSELWLGEGAQEDVLVAALGEETLVRIEVPGLRGEAEPEISELWWLSQDLSWPTSTRFLPLVGREDCTVVSP